MMKKRLKTGDTLGGRYVIGKMIHQGACGDWYDATPVDTLRGVGLPTEFSSRSRRTSPRVTVLIRESASGELVDTEAPGVSHPFLVTVSEPELIADGVGRSLLIRTTAHDLGQVATLLPPNQLAAQWRQLISAVASALAHLHAMGICHGAIRLDNIFQKEGGWCLGPTGCNRRAHHRSDLRELAHLIGVELKQLIKDPMQQALIHQLAELCGVNGIEAAHIGVWAEGGSVEVFRATPVRSTIATPKVEQTSRGLRLSTRAVAHALFLSCAPHCLPQTGALVPRSQLYQLGKLLAMSGANEAVIASPQFTIAVFCVTVSEGVARIGDHILVEPSRDWGHLHATIQPAGLLLQWFWPKEPSCRTMCIQLSPDRYPSSGTDRELGKLICDRIAYDAKAQCLIQLPSQWDRAFIRLARMDNPISDDRHAVYASAERKTPNPVPWLQRFRRPVRSAALQA